MRNRDNNLKTLVLDCNIHIRKIADLAHQLDQIRKIGLEELRLGLNDIVEGVQHLSTKINILLVEDNGMHHHQHGVTEHNVVLDVLGRQTGHQRADHLGSLGLDEGGPRLHTELQLLFDGLGVLHVAVTAVEGEVVEDAEGGLDAVVGIVFEQLHGVGEELRPGVLVVEGLEDAGISVNSATDLADRVSNLVLDLAFCLCQQNVKDLLLEGVPLLLCEAHVHVGECVLVGAECLLQPDAAA